MTLNLIITWTAHMGWTSDLTHGQMSLLRFASNYVYISMTSLVKMCHEIVGHCALLAMSYAAANRFWRVLLLFIAAEKLHKMEVLFFMTKMEVL